MQSFGSLDAIQDLTLTGIDSSSTSARLQALFDYSPVAIVALDSEHKFVMCNPAFMTLFQFTREELLATDLDELIAAPDATEEARCLSLAVLRGEKVHTVTQRRRKDGMTLDVEIHGIPLIVDGVLDGVYGVYQDVTERNKAQIAFRQLSQMLTDAKHGERRRIARDIHDSLSQELAVLNWNLTMLSRMVDDKQEALKEMVAQTKEIAVKCSTQIRSASYLLHPPMLGEEGLEPVVSRLAKEFERRSAIRVTLEIQDDLGRFPDVVEITVFRVLQESLANVLRHSGSPVVHLSLLKEESQLKLIVSDEGCNIRANAPTENGVGVSGMRERVEQLGGLLKIDRSRYGTTVIAALPIERSANA